MILVVRGGSELFSYNIDFCIRDVVVLFIWFSDWARFSSTSEWLSKLWHFFAAHERLAIGISAQKVRHNLYLSVIVLFTFCQLLGPVNGKFTNSSICGIL